MRIVPGLRELDDYHGLPGARAGGGMARFVSFLMMSAISVGAIFGAFALVKDALDRALGPGTVGRALQELDPNAAELYGLLNADWPSAPSIKSFAQTKTEDFGRQTFGQRKTPPPEPETAVALTTFMSEPGFAPSSAPSHAEINGFVEASRLDSKQSFQVVAPKGKSM
jgi:hypothetical protein